jgi:TrmH family RNA methyltransferase
VSYQVTKPVLDKIAFGERNEGIVVVAEEPDCSLKLFETKLNAIPGAVKTPLLAVLEGVEKPGNLGAVFRSADGAGLDGIIVADSLVDPFHSNAIRSSAGTVFRLPMVKMNTPSTIDYLRRKKIHIAVTRCGGAVSYTDYDFRQPTAIILGSEAVGLSDAWIADDMVPISLPMLGIADSLNISVAAAVLFYEARRQRGIQ